MDDFAAFSSAPANNNFDDFDRAASAFPDISLDGDIPTTSPPLNSGSAAPPGGFSFDSFDAPAVKVTGDDEFEKFEDQFPDIGVPSSPPQQQQSTKPSFGFGGAAVQSQPSYSSTPMFTQAIEEEEPEVIKCVLLLFIFWTLCLLRINRQWRETQAEEIRSRDEASKDKRQETISKAERAIDEFYEEYSKKKERTIRENKYVHTNFHNLFRLPTHHFQRC